MAFLKRCFEKVDFEKKNQQTRKKHVNFQAYKESIGQSFSVNHIVQPSQMQVHPKDLEVVRPIQVLPGTVGRIVTFAITWNIKYGKINYTKYTIVVCVLPTLH